MMLLSAALVGKYRVNTDNDMHLNANSCSSYIVTAIAILHLIVKLLVIVKERVIVLVLEMVTTIDIVVPIVIVIAMLIVTVIKIE